MKTKRAFHSCLVSLLLLTSLAEFSSAAGTEEKIYVITDYRYLPGAPGDSAETGLALCGTRCNAISTNYLNIVEPGGWRLIKVATGHELNVELKNPFMTGNCVCIADEYAVKVEIKNRLGKTDR